MARRDRVDVGLRSFMEIRLDLQRQRDVITLVVAAQHAATEQAKGQPPRLETPSKIIPMESEHDMGYPPVEMSQVVDE